MDKKIHKIFWLVFLSFVVLAVGEYVIYRKVMAINKVVSEQFMQVKETGKTLPPTLSPTVRVLKK